VGLFGANFIRPEPTDAFLVAELSAPNHGLLKLGSCGLQRFTFVYTNNLNPGIIFS